MIRFDCFACVERPRSWDEILGEFATLEKWNPSPMEVLSFHYVPRCSTAGCDRRAGYKVAALWSNGTSRELKNYGLACDDHKQAQLERARRNRELMSLAEGESIGEIGFYALAPGHRDLELQRLPEPPS